MLLVDSLYINCGGAMVLLRYLVDCLQEKNVDFFLLADARCGDEFNNLPHVEHHAATLEERRAFYQKHRDEFSSVLCFGNVPPPVKLKSRVYTYVHNINLLKIPAMLPWKRRIQSFLKQRVIDFYGKNTDAWIVQTENTKNELKRHLFSGKKNIYVLPFYLLGDELSKAKYSHNNRTDYALIGELSYPRGHGIVLDVWKQLHERGFDKTLHITVSNENERQKVYCQRVKELQDCGVKIVNHGFVPFSEVINIYKICKAIVYPSLNESLGLSIIEAIEAGCDVITSDLPYAYSICKPTNTFNPLSVGSVCNAIIQYDSNGGERSELKSKNMIDELIKEIQ